MAVKFSNNASTTLSNAINNVVVALAISVGEADRFPVLGAGDWFPITVIDAAGNMEIMRCTQRVGTTLTVVRAQEGTTAKAFPAGARVELRLTAAAISEFFVAANITGTIFDDSLPATMSAKTFNNSIAVNSSGNSALYYRQNGVDRVLVMFDTNVNEWQLHLYDNVGTWQRNLSYDVETGAFLVGGYIKSTGVVKAGEAVFHTDGNLQFPAGSLMALTYGPYLSDALAARITNNGGTYNISIYGHAASASNATNAAHAATAGNADTVDGFHASSFPQIYYGDIASETNYPVGHCVMFGGYHGRNQAINLWYGSDANSYNYSGTGTALSGIWRARGSFTAPAVGLAQRVA